MLSPRLNDCPECADIPSLLKKIDCKLAELGNNLYNNISYMLNKPVPADDILQLIGYRRILTHKYCNPNYVHKYSVKMIASRVIRLTLGCVSRCNEPERCLEEPCDITIVLNPSTTTTSTTQRITTTTTSSSSTSSTTSTSTSTSSTTTTTTTTGIPFCVTECLPLFSKGNGVFIYKDGVTTDLTSQITGPVSITGDVANTSNKLWLYTETDISEYDIDNFCPFAATYNRNINLASGLFGSGMTAIDDVTLVSSIGTDIVEVDITTTTAGITSKFPMPVNRDISGDLIYTTSNQLVCSYVDNITSNTYITIHDYSTGAILVDINISSITNPWGLYIDAGVIHVCDNNGQIFSLNLDTEVLTLVANVGQSLNGASQAPECAVFNIYYCQQYNWDLTGIDPLLETTIELGECLDPPTPYTLTDSVANFIDVWSNFCSGISPVVTVGIITAEGLCVSDSPVIIGTQSWDESDLRVTQYANGDPIPEVTNSTTWANLTTGAWCWYNNDPNSGSVLYNWYAINDPRGLAPAGKHVPTTAEWNTLISYLGSNTVAGGAMKDIGLSPWGWNSPNTDATNSSGFTAFPGGFINNLGVFDQRGNESVHWAADGSTSTDGNTYKLTNTSGQIFNNTLSKVFGLSVRLINN